MSSGATSAVTGTELCVLLLFLESRKISIDLERFGEHPAMCPIDGAKVSLPSSIGLQSSVRFTHPSVTESKRGGPTVGGQQCRGWSGI